MIAARSAAMAFNRWADASIDAANPRTSTRALPAGQLSSAFVVTFVVVSSAIFILAASQLNRLSLVLSPVALAVLLLYSYTKRVTRWSHLVLGFALGIAPAAAWIAVRGSLDPRILLLTAAVTFWVGGFDVLYACQDFDFDRQSGLHSIPRYVGIPAALWIARAFHAIMVGLLIALLVVFGMGKLAACGVLAVILLLALRTLAGPPQRSFQTQCRLLHHEWHHFSFVLRFRCGRFAPAEIACRVDSPERPGCDTPLRAGAPFLACFARSGAFRRQHQNAPTDSPSAAASCRFPSSRCSFPNSKPIPALCSRPVRVSGLRFPPRPACSR